MEFPKFRPIARFNREAIITEKIDGTNGIIYITDDGVSVGSRSRWIEPVDDNFGFAGWVHEHMDSIVADLGPGLHYGEWWGAGIQRGYGLPKGERRFSLFNTSRWTPDVVAGFTTPHLGVVPVIDRPAFGEISDAVDDAIKTLQLGGSLAAPGFMRPEGVVVYHTKADVFFKRTIEKDDEPKSLRVAS